MNAQNPNEEIYGRWKTHQQKRAQWGSLKTSKVMRASRGQSIESKNEMKKVR
jgi:hypothetical protein